jgi:arylformamidase
VVDLTRPLSVETGYAMWGSMLDDYPHLRDIEVQYISEFPKDNGTICRFTIGDHTATHVDAPVHIVEGGDDMAEADFTRFMGEAIVLDMFRGDVDYNYTADDLEAAGGDLVEPGDIVLIHSGFRDLTRTDTMRQTAVDVSGAEWLVERGVKAVGCEPIGIEHLPEAYLVHNYYERSHPNPWPVHRTLLGNDVYIVEGLASLEALKGQRVRFAALPLRFPGLSGSPVRAVAWTE